MIDNELKEIEVEYLYLTIPSKYICTYHKLIMYLADFGKDILDDCKATCGSKGKTVVSCWNLFQSAIANFNIGKYKEADFFIDYIEKQLKLVYNNNTPEPVSIPVKITEDGRLKAIVSCDSSAHFYVDVETGELLKEYTNSNNYRIEDNDLIFDKTSTPVEEM